MKVTSVHLPLSSLAVCAAMSGVFLLASSPAQACPDEVYLGAICTLGTTYCPEGFLPAQGQILQIQGNNALFSLLSTTYGGDGRTTFALPDLRGRVPIAQGYLGSDTYLRGTVLGSQAAILTDKNLPQHTHAAAFTPATANQLTATVGFQASADVPASGSANPSAATPYMAANSAAKMWATAPQTNLVTVSGISASVPGTLTGSVTNATAGGSAGASVQPPTMAVTYCIATVGYYPPRD